MKNKRLGGALDDLLEEEGVLEEEDIVKLKPVTVHIRHTTRSVSFCGRGRKDLAMTLEAAKRHPVNAGEKGVVCKTCRKAWMNL